MIRQVLGKLRDFERSIRFVATSSGVTFSRHTRLTMIETDAVDLTVLCNAHTHTRA